MIDFSIEKFISSTIKGSVPETIPPRNAWMKAERANLINESLKESKISGLICEFGVLKGRTITQIAKFFSEEPVYGFDSFEGLPEEWRMRDDFSFSKGSMSVNGYLPVVPANVELIKGWYNESLPAWVKNHNDPIKFIHVDCDLYSSTIEILKILNDQIIQGTIIHFDDFYSWSDPEEFTHWADGEYKALKEWAIDYNREFEILHRNRYFQCAIRILK